MGQYWSRLFHSNRKYRILMIGLESSGKTSILYGLKLGEVVSTIPSIAIFPTTIYEMDGVMRAFDWLNMRLETRDLKAACVTPVADTVSDLQDTITKSKRNLTEYFKRPLVNLKLWLS